MAALFNVASYDTANVKASGGAEQQWKRMRPDELASANHFTAPAADDARPEEAAFCRGDRQWEECHWRVLRRWSCPEEVLAAGRTLRKDCDRAV